ncbi:hypothetical protein AB0G06_43455 [Nonomuraea dietziae]|uniref:hypothetical protein n=1 Tax=Nonomuraea dietziae TaxID=65515 RepID=UPI0033CF598B
MTKYEVQLARTDWYRLEVEADNEDEALDAAYNDAPSLCAHCTGWGYQTEGSVDADDWLGLEDFYGSRYDGAQHGVTIKEVK